MKILHACAAVSILFIGAAWGADDPAAVSTAALPGWLDPAGWGKAVGGIGQIVIGIIMILLPLLKKAWRGKIIQKIPWFARPFVKHYLTGWFFVARQKFPYPPGSTPEQEQEFNKLRRDWVVAKAKSGPWWIQLIVAGMDEAMIESVWKSAWMAFKEMEAELK